MNHYDVLEVSPRASAEVIRAAYKSLMQRYHPDKNPDTAEFAKTATRITQAYEVLGDADKRAAYDLGLRASARPGMPDPTAPGGGRARERTAAAVGRRAGADRRSWLAWAVIVCIIAAGAIILLQSRKPAVAPPAARLQADAALPPPAGQAAPAAADAATPDASPRAGPAAATDTAADREARTVSLLNTRVSINLAPYDRTSEVHVLQISEIAIRVDAPDAVRWAKKIGLQREEVLQYVLLRLGDADYLRLLKPDAEQYIKRIVALAVMDSIDYSEPLPQLPPPPPPSGSGALPPPRPFVVSLPQSFTVR